MIVKKDILGVKITDATATETLEYIVESLENFHKKYYIVTPNPEFLVLAHKDFRFRSILNNAEIALPDGIGLMIASKILGNSLKERVTGVDLLENLCKRLVRKPITVGFLGGRDGVAEKTAECLRKKYPGLKIGFVGEEWPKDDSGRLPHVVDDARLLNFKNQSVNSVSLSKSRLQSGQKPTFSSSASGQAPSMIHNSKFMIQPIDILFVAFGAPKQEIWIEENLDKIPVKIAVGVGGAFDYIGGRVKRAPAWIRNLGFEWLYRLINQPWRLKRQLALVEFGFLVLKKRFFS